jgi:hypothetical protein
MPDLSKLNQLTKAELITLVSKAMFGCGGMSGFGDDSDTTDYSTGFGAGTRRITRSRSRSKSATKRKTKSKGKSKGRSRSRSRSRSKSGTKRRTRRVRKSTRRIKKTSANFGAGTLNLKEGKWVRHGKRKTTKGTRIVYKNTKTGQLAFKRLVIVNGKRRFRFRHIAKKSHKR